MDAFFAGLTKRQAMLLLTAVTFGGAEGVDSFDWLPDDEAELLTDRARQILEIPREKRLPFLVSEIKRFITGHKLDVLRFANPARVAEALKKERPAMVEVILRALPGSVAEEARVALAQPVVELSRKVRPDVLAVIRWKFEERLSKDLPVPAAFSLSDLVGLPSKDLMFLADVLGARSLAAILAALSEAEREEILKKLSPEQRQAARAASPRKAKLAPEKARELVEKAFADAEPKSAVRLMGVRRVAKACLSQSAEFAARVIEGHRDEFGRQLAQFVSEERQKGSHGDPAVRDELLHELEDLAERGVLDRPMRTAAPPPRASAGAQKRLSESAVMRPAVKPTPAPARAPVRPVAEDRRPAPAQSKLAPPRPASFRPEPAKPPVLAPRPLSARPPAPPPPVEPYDSSQTFDMGSKVVDIIAQTKGYDSGASSLVIKHKTEPRKAARTDPPPAGRGLPIQRGGAAAEPERSREYKSAVRRPSVIRPLSLRGPRKP